MSVDPNNGRFMVVFLKKTYYPIEVCRWDEEEKRWEMFAACFAKKTEYHVSDCIELHYNYIEKIVQSKSIRDCLLEMLKHGPYGFLATEVLVEKFL